MSPKRFLVYKIFQNLLLIYPVYPLLFSEAGLSVSQISLLLAIWSIPVILLELPSGILADRWSRKYLVVLSSLLRALCFMVWIILPTFLGFAVGFLFWGTSEALASGAEEALLFDTLKAMGNQEAFASAYGKSSGAASLAVALACLTGGVVVQHAGYRMVLLLSVVCSLVSTFIAVGSKDIHLYRSNTMNQMHTSWKMVLSACNHIIHNRSVRVLTVALIVPISLSGILDEYDPLIASSYGLGVSYVGLWTGGRYILESLGSLVAATIRKRNASTPLLFSMIAGCSLLLYVLGSRVLFLPWYFLFFFLLAAAVVMQEDLIQQSIEDQGRSTVHSVVTLMVEIHALVFFLVLGLLRGLSQVVVVIALYGLIASLVLIILKNSQ